MASNPTDDVNLECINALPGVSAPQTTAPAKPKPAVGSPSRDKQITEQEWFEFQDLILKEFKCLHPEDWPPRAAPSDEVREANFQTADPGPGDEPCVVFTKRDYFGLALSGGGIRSATFNLGLLQGLNLSGILEHVDYLSTVSGGGYIGGFWTAWRHFRKDDPKSASFPPQSDPTTKPDRMRDVRELGPFRHLREFSRFLLPRVGLTEGETWSGIVTILAGVVPSLTATTALVTLAIYLWYGFNHWMLTTNAVFGAATLFVGTLLLQVLHERSWRKQGKGGTAVGTWDDFIKYAIMTAIAAVIGWAVWAYFLANANDYAWLPKGLSNWSAESPAGKVETFAFSAAWLGPAVA
ncbi:MAG TPA: patatin-like phospholipase family protein, partial [Verrucomicrobiae bacterium]|nr:patatin-like phospholipase family protein [Verrucomicrobiae bacterium]